MYDKGNVGLVKIDDELMKLIRAVEHGNEIRDLVLMSATAKWVQKERKFDIYSD